MFHSSFQFKNLVFISLYRISSVIAQTQQWPIGTLASASTTHAPLSGGPAGQFTADKAIDNESATFWNDDTDEGGSKAPYPDILSLNIGSAVTLDGLILLSHNDGWPLNYTVETSVNGASWTVAATVDLSNVVLRVIRFDKSPLSLKQLRVNVTASLGGYTRIAELSPIYAAAAFSNSTTDNPLSTPDNPLSTPTPQSTSSQTKSNTAGITAGVLGGVAGILLAILGYLLWLLRRQRNKIVTTGVDGTGDGIAVDRTQKIPVRNPRYHTIFVGEVGGQPPQEAGGYSRTELA